MKIELTQIRIEGWSLDVGANFEDLYKIYEHVLQNDDWWHFFREGDYTLIRCLNKNVKQVSKLLEIEHGIMPGQIKVTKPWIDNISTTRAYQEEFTYMFHAFSVLSMKLLEEEDKQSPYEVATNFIGVFDRVVHCFLNSGRSHEKVKSFIPLYLLKKIIMCRVYGNQCLLFTML